MTINCLSTEPIISPIAKQTMPSCPLCKAKTPKFYHRNSRRQYFQCTNCSLVFVAPEYYISAKQEKEEYDKHCNSPHDIGYRNFLKRIFDPLRERINPGSHGLDFGSGPGPTLSVMFEEAGFLMTLYDHFYAADKKAFEQKYDFITATEVVEHLHSPDKELKALWNILKPGGYLGIMTKQVIDQQSFSRWHYIQDPTHVCFFSAATFKWLAKLWQAEFTTIGKDVVIFKKQLYSGTTGNE